MSPSWRSVRLGDHVSVRHGFAFDGAHFVDAPTSNILMTPGNFEIGGGFKLDKPKYYDGPVDEAYLLNPGDVIVTMTDLSKAADTLGYAAVVPHDSRYRFLHNQRIGKVVTKSNSVELAFLHWLMRSPDYRAEVLASASGSTVKHTAPSRIEAFQFKLPPITEQRAIASILGALDDKIELNRRMNETLEDLARTIFKSWFVDFDPVKAKAEGRQPAGMDAETAKLFPSRFVESELGMIPEGWRLSTVGDVCQSVTDCVHTTPRWTDTGRLVVRSSNVRNGFLDFSSASYTDEEHYLLRIRRATPKPNDIIITREAPMGELALVPFGMDLCLGQRVVLLRADDEIVQPHLLYWTLRSPIAHNQIQWHEGTGSTVSNLRIPALCAIRLIVPPAQLQSRAVPQLSTLHQMLEANVAESANLGKMRDALLPKLVSGELRVPDAEKLVEATL